MLAAKLRATAHQAGALTNLGTKRAPGKAQKSAKPWNINRAGWSSRIRSSGKDKDKLFVLLFNRLIHFYPPSRTGVPRM
jgi:hypothetical protein